MSLGQVELIRSSLKHILNMKTFIEGGLEVYNYGLSVVLWSKNFIEA